MASDVAVTSHLDSPSLLLPAELLVGNCWSWGRSSSCCGCLSGGKALEGEFWVVDILEEITDSSRSARSLKRGEKDFEFL